MRIVVIGTRGIPGIQGGVETHCEELYPRLVALGHDVTVIRRSPYVNDNNNCKEYKGVKIIDLWAPKSVSLEAFTHTLFATFKAKVLKADIVHIHAIGPALLVPLAKMLGMKVVCTHHGPDYDRQKWGAFAKMMLKLGEKLGAKCSDRQIVISQVIADNIANKYGRSDTDLIYNGVNAPNLSSNTDYIGSLGFQPRKYVVALGRFVKEKGFHDLIRAFEKLNSSEYKLVIAGDADHPSDYSIKLKEEAAKSGVVLTGFIKGEKLNQLMSHAALFVLPSYHEGLPISLLEAMSYKLDVLVSDIPANLIDELEPADFYNVGDVESLAAALKRKLDAPATPRTYDLSRYNWDNIAKQVSDIYNQLGQNSKK